MLLLCTQAFVERGMLPKAPARLAGDALLEVAACVFEDIAGR